MAAFDEADDAAETERLTGGATGRVANLGFDGPPAGFGMSRYLRMVGVSGAEKLLRASEPQDLSSVGTHSSTLSGQTSLYLAHTLLLMCLTSGSLSVAIFLNASSNTVTPLSPIKSFDHSLLARSKPPAHPLRQVAASSFKPLFSSTRIEGS